MGALLCLPLHRWSCSRLRRQPPRPPSPSPRSRSRAKRPPPPLPLPPPWPQTPQLYDVPRQQAYSTSCAFDTTISTTCCDFGTIICFGNSFLEPEGLWLLLFTVGWGEGEELCESNDQMLYVKEVAFWQVWQFGPKDWSKILQFRWREKVRVAYLWYFYVTQHIVVTPKSGSYSRNVFIWWTEWEVGR